MQWQQKCKKSLWNKITDIFYVEELTDRQTDSLMPVYPGKHLSNHYIYQVLYELRYKITKCFRIQYKSKSDGKKSWSFNHLSGLFDILSNLKHQIIG